jgi:uncharacterized membrane protein
MSQKRTGIALATAAAALFATGAVLTPVVNATEGEVKCAGVNSCKGHSECNTATSECKGLNSCKGQGWVFKASKQECETAGGKVVEG